MAKVTYVLAQGENSAGESQVNFRVYVSRELRVRVPSGIWVDRKRWGKKNDINIPNIPGEERDALLAKRAKLKELVDVIETSVEAADDKSTVTREWLEKLIRRTLRPKTATSVEEKKIGSDEIQVDENTVNIHMGNQTLKGCKDTAVSVISYKVFDTCDKVEFCFFAYFCSTNNNLIY